VRLIISLNLGALPRTRYQVIIKVMAKSAQRLEARRLRTKGISVNVIAKKLKVSKSSVCLWCDDIDLTEEQREILIKHSRDAGEKGRLLGAKANKEERVKRQKYFEDEGIKEVGILSKRELFLVGVALYWSEGSKKNRRVVLANSDPAMVCLFIRWLKEYLCVDMADIYCTVSINQDHQIRIKTVEGYWSKITGIHLSSFTKPSYKQVKNKKVYENFNDHYGTLFLKLRKSTNSCYRILGYIEGLKKNCHESDKIA